MSQSSRAERTFPSPSHRGPVAGCGGEIARAAIGCSRSRVMSWRRGVVRRKTAERPALPGTGVA